MDQNWQGLLKKDYAKPIVLVPCREVESISNLLMSMDSAGILQLCHYLKFKDIIFTQFPSIRRCIAILHDVLQEHNRFSAICLLMGPTVFQQICHWLTIANADTPNFDSSRFRFIVYSWPPKMRHWWHFLWKDDAQFTALMI